MLGIAIRTLRAAAMHRRCGRGTPSPIGIHMVLIQMNLLTTWIYCFSEL
jgi:hypothetical protein